MADLPRISAKLRTSVEQIDKTLASPEFKQLMEGLSASATNAAPAAVELRRVLRELSNLLTSQGQDIQSIVVNLRKFVENAAEISQDAKSNPSRDVVRGAAASNEGGRPQMIRLMQQRAVGLLAVSLGMMALWTTGCANLTQPYPQKNLYVISAGSAATAGRESREVGAPRLGRADRPAV